MQPKGFGKKYFTLAAIQATTAHVTIAGITTKIESQHLSFSQEDDLDELLEDEELQLLESTCEALSYGSHLLNTTQTLNPSSSPPLIIFNSNLHVYFKI